MRALGANTFIYGYGELGGVRGTFWLRPLLFLKDLARSNIVFSAAELG